MSTPAERAAAIAKQARVELTDTRKHNRAYWPDEAKFLDDFRAYFGHPAYFVFTDGKLTVEWLNPDYVRRVDGTLKYTGEPLV